MNRTAGLAAMAAILLAGCGSHHHHLQRLGDALHGRPLVTVRQGVISAAPDPIVLKLGELKGPIVWRVPPGFTFPVDGIEILGQVVDRQGRTVPPSQAALKDPTLGVQAEGKRAFECKVNEKDRQEYACEAVRGRITNGVYRYAIRVLDKDGKRIEWDPSIFAMD